MGILTPNVEEEKTVVNNTVKEKVLRENPVTKKFDYDSVVEDNKQTSYKNLLSHIAGSSWITTYYSQQLSKDDEPTPQDLSLDPTYQQYVKIEDLEFKVSSSLSQSQNQETNEFEVSGESTLYPPVIPNKGDMFYADIGDGKKGLFAIVEAERLTIRKETCYNVSYTLIDYLSDDRYEDLELKTIKRTHFVKKLLQHDTDPIVVDDQYNKYLVLSEMRSGILSEYMSKFYDKGNRTLVLPGQKEKTYDPFIVKFIKSFTETNDNPYLKELKRYTVELPGVKEPLTIWDAILRHFENILPLTNQKLALVRSGVFKTVPQFDGVYFTQMTDVVYPVDGALEDVSFDLFQVHEDVRDMYESGVLNNTNNLSDDYQESTEGLVKIKPVASDDFYVFSRAFYLGEVEQMSQLEKIVWDTLDWKTFDGHKPIDQKKLYELAKSIHNWTLLDQFYYTPIILVLIKMVVHGL